MTRLSGGHKVRPKGTRSTRARAIVRFIPFDSLQSELDVTHFPAVFHRPKTGKAPRIQPIYRATATHWQLEHETTWDTFGRYALALGLAVGIDRGGFVHTSFAPVEMRLDEEERAAALETALEGDLGDDQARKFLGDRDGEGP